MTKLKQHALWQNTFWIMEKHAAIQGKKSRHMLRCFNYYSTSISSQDEYLHRSSVPTYHFQKSLPRLPIPQLEKSCERYLLAQRPLLNDEQYDATERIAKSFCGGDGKILQDQLIAKDKRNKHTSYITDYWFDMYLADRRPVVLNHNPFIAFNDDKRAEYMNPVVRATNMLVTAARFLLTLESSLLSPEVYHLDPAKSDTPLFRQVVRWLPQSLAWYGAYMFNAYPLDMTQFPYLMNSTRLPVRGAPDRLLQDPASPGYVLVMRNGHLYKLPLLDADGNISAASDILAHLTYIMSDPRSAAVHQYSPGYLTSMERDLWADMREHLVNIGNAEALKIIDSSMFALCMDEVSYGDDPVAIARNFLHGNGANRWFDKSFSVLMQQDGRAAVNFEHSWGDGVAVLRFFNEVYNESISAPRVSSGDLTGVSPAAADSENIVEKIELNLDDKARACIDEARQKFERQVASMDMHAFKSEQFGKALLKREKMSPDAIMQLGFQLAHQHYKKRLVSTYESCSTAAFRRGRTETVRPVSLQMKACIDTIYNESRSASDIKELIRASSVKHGQLIKEAAMGQGFDRHLFALRHLAEEGGMSCEMFDDPAYKSICHIVISTSTLSTDSVMIGGFGPVNPDCLGIGYNISDDSLGVVLSTYPSHQNGSDFIECLRTSFTDIYSVLNQTTSK